MAETTTTEYRVRRYDPRRPDEDITWDGPFPTAGRAEAHAAQARRDYDRHTPGNRFTVELHRVTVTTTPWEPVTTTERNTT